MLIAPTWGPGTLVLDTPIVFARLVPTGAAESCKSGLRVEVHIKPSLHVLVLLADTRHVALTGHCERKRLVWDQAPSAELPSTACSILANDICDALHLFRAGLINPRFWTSNPEALGKL